MEFSSLIVKDSMTVNVFNEFKEQKWGADSSFVFVIHSLLTHYNGLTNLNVVVTDDSLKKDTLDIPIYIDHKNDDPELLSIVKIADTEYGPSNDMIHLVEDTSPVEFTIKVIDIDSDILLNKDIRYELKELEWNFLH